jgi:ribosome-associated heat shock protein Hsp15
MSGEKPNGDSGQRIDRWLWFARVFKSRSLATRAIAQAGVRVTRAGLTQRIEKPAFAVRNRDVVTLKRGDEVRVLEVVGLGWRRGPASEAQTLYRDLSPPGRKAPERLNAPRPPTKPGKKDRRTLDRLRRPSQFDDE